MYLFLFFFFKGLSSLYFLFLLVFSISSKAFWNWEKCQKGKLEEPGAEGNKARGWMPCEKVGEVQSRGVKVKQSDCIQQEDRENTHICDGCQLCLHLCVFLHNL